MLYLYSWDLEPLAPSHIVPFPTTKPCASSENLEFQKTVRGPRTTTLSIMGVALRYSTVAGKSLNCMEV